MNNNKIALKSGAWYMVSNFLIKGVGLITTPFFTRLLSKSEFGLFNNYTSWLSILTIFITLNLEASLISARFDYENDLDGYIYSMIGLGIVSSVCWSIICLVFKEPIANAMHIESSYLEIMMMYIMFLPALQMFITKERYLFKYKGSVFISILTSVSSAVMSIILVLIMNDKLLGRIIGSAIPSIVLGIFFCVYFKVKGKKINLLHWKYALPICLPYIPHLLGGTMLNSMDRIMIEHFCGSEDVAVYSLAYTCAMLVTLLVTSLNSAFAPWLIERLHFEQFEEIKKISTYYISIFMLFVCGIMLIAPDILYILGGETYMEAKYVMAPVAMGCVCQFLYTLFVNIEQFMKKTFGMAIATLIAAGVNLILNLIFIPLFGYLAAAYTTLIGFLLLLVIHIFLVKKLNLLKVYNMKTVWETVGLGLIGMLLINVGYYYLIIRIILIFLYAIIMFIYLYHNRNIIKRIIVSRRKKK